MRLASGTARPAALRVGFAQSTLRPHLRPRTTIHAPRKSQPLPAAAADSAGEPEGATKASGIAGTLERVLPPSDYTIQFRLRRWLLFTGLVLGYSFCYLCRNSINSVVPVMVADPKLGLDITQAAAMTSIFPLAYGSSKFISGVLGARTSPRLLLASGLFLTAAVNILFGFSSSLFFFCCLWAFNGVVQGFGGPSCARMLTTWFASKERGTYWGLWNIAHNLGGFLAPIICGLAARDLGWRFGMWVPGMMGIGMGIYVLLACADSPEKAGYPAVEKVEKAPKKKAAAEEVVDEDKPSILEMLMKDVLKNPFIWGMALTYFCIYAVRQGVTSWGLFYLTSAKGVADTAQAGFIMSALELGGLAGSLLAGRLADWLVNRAAKAGKIAGSVGKRVQVVMAYTLGIAAMLAAFRVVPGGIWWLQWPVVFMLGFFIYGPQMLIGLCGAELVGPESVGASEGFLGWIAYFGAAFAGIPTGYIVKVYGWDAYFVALIIACGAALALLSPMMNLKSFVQRESARAAKAASGPDGGPSPAAA